MSKTLPAKVKSEDPRWFGTRSSTCLSQNSGGAGIFDQQAEWLRLQPSDRLQHITHPWMIMNGVFGAAPFQASRCLEMLFETGCEQETTSRHSSESVWTLPNIGSLWHHVLAGRLLTGVLRWSWVGPSTRRWFRVLSVLRICISCPPRRPQWSPVD